MNKMNTLKMYQTFKGSRVFFKKKTHIIMWVFMQLASFILLVYLLVAIR